MAARTTAKRKAKAKGKTKQLLSAADDLAKARTDLEKRGKLLRGRSELLEQVQRFLVEHWTEDHPNTCPTCSSDVSARSGIQSVVDSLKIETNQTLQTLREKYAEIQTRQRTLATELQAQGDATPPIKIDEQARLIEWLTPFLRQGMTLEDSLIGKDTRRQLKEDLARMKLFPQAPSPYANARVEAERLAGEFNRLTEDADHALEGPQAIGEVRKILEQCLEKVLTEHLPATIGRVWKNNFNFNHRPMVITSIA